MSAITLETRKKAYEEVKHTLSKRENEVLEALGNNEMTANEIAYKLFEERKTPFFNRNYVAPRLNTLENWGIVEVVGKKKDFVGKTCGVYRKVINNSVEKCVDNSTKRTQPSNLYKNLYEMKGIQ